MVDPELLDTDPDPIFLLISIWRRNGEGGEMRCEGVGEREESCEKKNKG